MIKTKTWAVVATGVLLLAVMTACGGNAPPPAPTATPAPATLAPTDTPQPAPTVTPTPISVTATAVLRETDPLTTPTPLQEPAPDQPAAPTDEEEVAPPSRVEAVIASFSEAPQAQGDVVVLFGQVLGTDGTPVEGAAVEIWQTDANGVYDHPGDPSTADRDRSFQFYGSSVVDDDGFYAFRTVRPGHYEPRPSHFHVKVRVDGQPVLTTQFYFGDERDALAGEGLFARAGDRGDLLVLDLEEGTGVDGTPILLANKDLILDIGAGEGTLTATPPQGEGPYYPVVTVADYDHDLTVVP